MKTPEHESPLDAETISDLANAMRPAELGSAERDRMRARIMRRVGAPAPTGMTTLRADEGVWSDYSPGVKLKILKTEPAAGSMTFLIRMEPGAHAPAHPHSQEEQCLVLEGEVTLGDHVIRAGDWHVALPGSVHTHFFSKTGCLLLVRGEMRHA